MTMSFAEQVKQAVDEVERTPETAPAQRYRAVLDELARGLRDLGVGARILPGPDPRKLALYVHPPFRPASGSLMLSFFLDGDTLRVSGESPETLKSAEELERFLLKFVRLPAFVESLRILREQATLPVEARLRVSEQITYSKGDVVVEVTPDDQQKLFEAAEHERVELDVERIQFPGNAQFGEATYEVLESAGVILVVDDTRPAGAKLHVIGTRL